MYIYLTEVGNSSNRFTFPSLPESVQVKGSARYQSYDIISIGTVKIPKGTESGTISFDGTFFGAIKKNEIIVQQWKAPKECISILEKWRDAGTVLRLLVTETSINHDVTIQSFDGEENGAFGNYDYSISFVKNRELKIYTTDELKITAYVKATTNRPSTPTGGTYTVVMGDNLWKIAQKKLGKATRWQEIYNLNKDTIEASAKRYRKSSSNNGWWIFPGDVYTLPA